MKTRNKGNFMPEDEFPGVYSEIQDGNIELREAGIKKQFRQR